MKKIWFASLTILLACAGAWASEVVSEVIRLQKNGSDEAALTAYVQKSDAFTLSVDEISQLETAGVPSSVIVAMLDRENSGAERGTRLSGRDDNGRRDLHRRAGSVRYMERRPGIRPRLRSGRNCD